eukprot:6188523-Pleurochrysis_carterae.AAC.4
MCARLEQLGREAEECWHSRIGISRKPGARVTRLRKEEREREMALAPAERRSCPCGEKAEI